jgi:hypothetical protein
MPNTLSILNHEVAMISEFNVKGMHKDANKMSLMARLMRR